MPSYRNELVSFDCDLKHETDRAFIVVIDDREFSIPKSISTLTHDYLGSVTGTIEMPTWKAEELDLA